MGIQIHTYQIAVYGSQASFQLGAGEVPVLDLGKEICNIWSHNHQQKIVEFFLYNRGI